MIWVASKNSYEEFEAKLKLEQERADAAEDYAEEEVEAAQSRTREAEAELEKAKEEIATTKAELATGSGNGKSKRLASALLNIERIHRDGSNPWALALAHNELDKALTKLILA